MDHENPMNPSKTKISKSPNIPNELINQLVKHLHGSLKKVHQSSVRYGTLKFYCLKLHATAIFKMHNSFPDKYFLLQIFASFFAQGDLTCNFKIFEILKL